MGFAELYSALNLVYNQKVIKNFPKIILLITLGDLGFSEDLTNLVKNNSLTARLHIIGIENLKIPYLFINKLAKFGKGSSIILNEKSIKNLVKSTEKIMENAISPFFYNFEVKIIPWNAIEYITYNKKNFPLLIKNEPFQLLFKLFPENFKNSIEIIISYQSSFSDSKYQETIKLNKENIKLNDILHKVAYNEYIEKLENSYDTNDKKVIDLSENFQILCERTAFFLKENKNNSEKIEDYNDLDYIKDDNIISLFIFKNEKKREKTNLVKNKKKNVKQIELPPFQNHD